MSPGQEGRSAALPLSPRLKPPDSHSALAAPRTDRGWNFMVPAVPCRGQVPTQSRLHRTLVPPEAPRPFPQLCPGRWRVMGEGSPSPAQEEDQNRGGKAPFSSTARTQSLLQPALFIFLFPVAFWEPTSRLSFAPFPSSGDLGIKAWLLSTQTDPAWRGQDGTTSFSTSAQVRALSRVLLSVRHLLSRPWAGNPPPSQALSCFLEEAPTPSQAFVGLGQSPVGDGLGLQLLEDGGGGGMTLQPSPPILHVAFSPWWARCGHGGRSWLLDAPRLRVPEPHTEPSLVLVPSSPCTTPQLLGRPGWCVTWEAFSLAHEVLAHRPPPLWKHSRHIGYHQTLRIDGLQGNPAMALEGGHGHMASRGPILAQNPCPESPFFLAHPSLGLLWTCRAHTPLKGQEHNSPAPQSYTPGTDDFLILNLSTPLSLIQSYCPIAYSRKMLTIFERAKLGHLLFFLKHRNPEKSA